MAPHAYGDTTKNCFVVVYNRIQAVESKFKGVGMAEAERGYYAGEAAEIAEIPYRTLDHWARTGLVTPSISEAKGAGRSRLYSFKDVVWLRTARELRDEGVSVQAIRKVLKLLADGGLDTNDTESRLLVIGRDVAIARTTGEIESLLRSPGQLFLNPAMLFDLRKPMGHVKRNVEARRSA